MVAATSFPDDDPRYCEQWPLIYNGHGTASAKKLPNKEPETNGYALRHNAASTDPIATTSGDGKEKNLLLPKSKADNLAFLSLLHKKAVPGVKRPHPPHPLFASDKSSDSS